jgi:hypothetical protein
MQTRLAYNVSGLYFVIVSWHPIGQQSFIDFFCHTRLLPIGLKNLKIVRQRQKKMTNSAPHAVSEALAASQSSSISSIS